MRLTRWMSCAMLIASAACSNGLTAPPSGFDVRISVVVPDGSVHGPFITGAGDSVIALVVQPGSLLCAPVPAAAAGLRDGGLVVTLTNVVQDHPCPAFDAVSTFAIVVHGVPSGTRQARVVMRIVSGEKARYSELVSGSITVH